MTSTSFNVGLNDSSRSSSRVLRPPGGGHTDIFGGQDLPQVKKDNGRNASSIMEGTNANPVPPSPSRLPQLKIVISWANRIRLRLPASPNVLVCHPEDFLRGCGRGIARHDGASCT
ncbi:hypothetical protein NQ318_001243 [Aromia moschata]|uniref:Microtubule-associated protein Jupiter n=1 Tax=Aromia moschata TaxID=1265417 RepID=A0AAV8ZF97_9CUCU|nr:hypothetical protein NQ318_001243 [Aromia moschata]